MNNVPKKPYYKVNLKSLGAISQLPDSQKIFGAVVWRMAVEKENFKFDEESITQLSNVFPEGYLPNVYDWYESEDEKYDKQYQVSISIDNEQCNWTFHNEGYKTGYKKNKYIPISTENESKIEMNRTFRDRNNYQQILSGRDGVFSVPFYEIIEKKNTESKEAKDYYFLIQCDKEVIEYLKKDTVLKLGERANQGMNIYEIQDVEEITIKEEPQNAEEITIEEESQDNIYMNIGMLGMSNMSKMNLDISKYHTYQSLRKGYIDYKNVNVVKYIAPGSIICLKDKNINDLDKCQKVSENKYIFTGGFLLPLVRMKNE